MKIYHILYILFSCFQIIPAWSQKWQIVQDDKDTIEFKPTQIVITPDTFFLSASDTFVILQKGTKYKIRSNPYSKSEVFYDSLIVKSYKHKITKELYQFFFKSVPIEVQDTSNFDNRESEFLIYNGLKIRNIILKKVDIIEGSIYDTLVEARSFWAKRANDLHIDTRNFVIKNNLTIKKGDLIDANKLSDNERILRNLPYIEDARIHVIPVESDSSQVDVMILTKDKFSAGIGLDFNSIDNFSTYLYNKNFVGIGHEMRNYLIYRSGYIPEFGYAFRYKINNLSNTFTSLRIEYENSWDRKYTGINLSKDFLTQQTKYAGALSLYQISDAREYSISSKIETIPYKTVIQDFWLGRAFLLDKTKATTFITSLRYANANFSVRPFVSSDSNYFYHDRNLTLFSLSLTRLKYYLSSLVYAFGVTEDIPYGYNIKMVTGFENDQFFKRPYFSTAISYGKHFPWPGYLLFNAEFGSFYNQGVPEDRILKLKFLKIGNILHINHYSLRNFIDIDFQSGLRMSDPDYKAFINGQWTTIISGLNRDGLKGQEKITLTHQSVLFTPWYILGFKFALLGYINLGWVSQESLLQSRSFYGNIGLGFRIKNESWIFETITFGMAFFLKAPPGSGKVGFIFDATDPKLFRNLNPGKPDLVRMDQSPVLFLE